MMDGHVSIPLGEASATLVPSLGAAIALCREHGSFAALMDKVANYDLPACATVVHHGLSRFDDERGRTEAEVYEAGMVALAPHLLRFIGILANGGKPLPKEDEKPTGPFVA